MVKKTLKTALLCSFLLGSSLVAGETIILDKNSEEGRIILQSDKEYKAYLNKAKSGTANKSLIEQNNCDISMLKVAVAKLIIKVEGLEKKNIKDRAIFLKEINRLKSAKKSLEKDNKRAKMNGKDKNSLLDSVDNASLIDSVSSSNELVKIAKRNCSNEKVYVKYKVSAINGSYIKFDKLTNFKVNYSSLKVYKKPLPGFEQTGKTLLKGTKVKADMYTLAGWVHVKNTGWVKGFKLYPKVLQKKVKRNFKIVEKCD